MSTAYADDSPLSLIDSSDPGAAHDPGDASPDEGAGGEHGSGAPGLSPGEQLGLVIQRTVEPIVHSTSQQLAAMQQQVNRVLDMVTRGQVPTSPNPTAPAESKDAKLERFVADPDGYENAIVERATKAALERVAPYLMGPSSDVQERVLSEEAQAVDAEYGPGTFNELVRPGLTEALQGMSEPLRYNPGALRTAVSAMLGSRQLRPQLLSKRDAYARQQAEARAKERARRPQPPNFMGSRGRDESGRPIITPEDRQVLEALAKNGYTMTETDLRTVRSIPRGVSLDEQLEAMERLERGKGAA